MHRINRLVKQASLVFLGLPLMVTYPTLAVTPAADSTTSGLTQPTGPEAETYHYNETTGMWENDYYIWDPTTHKAQPKTPQNYSYNPATNKWDSTEWRYDAPSGAYQPNTVSTPVSPAEAPSQASPGGESTPAQPLPPPPTTDAVFSGFYNASISNTAYSGAHSGNANVSSNTRGGTALSGDANAISNIFNLLQSTAPLSDQSQFMSFTSTIDGAVTGDFYIDPAMLNTLQPASGNSANPTHIQINTASHNNIHNTIGLEAGSGNAAVSGNTTAGDAISGSANAVANIVNMINSSVAAGQSFVGLLNIHGDLNGDILLPPGTLEALLAVGGAPNGTKVLTSEDATAQHSNVDDTQSIHNQVLANAQAGDAKVSGNTVGGNAITGDAATNITLLNLANREIVGRNSLLVFVNVLGQWVGAIVNAPEGSTSAALGGGVTRDKPYNADLAATSNNGISNVLRLNAKTGDALVQHNTTAGNARSGKATASATLTNISNSSLSFADWFGIVFINVFGLWNGSFGIDTEAGTVLAGAALETWGDSQLTKIKAPEPVLHFVAGAPIANSSHKTPSDTSSTKGILSTDDFSEKVLELAPVDESYDGRESAANSKITATPVSRNSNLETAASALTLGAMLIGLERVLAWRERQSGRKG